MKITRYFTPEVQRRSLVTLALILAFRIGCQIPTPGVDTAAVAQAAARHQGGLFGFLDLWSGGALERCSVFALGLQPYINASIIMQLLAHAVPALERLRKHEGGEGRKTLERWTRYAAVALGIVQALGLACLIERWSGGALVSAPGWPFRATAALALALGSGVVIGMGELITKYGLGQGSSVLIVSGIVARGPASLIALDQGLASPAAWIGLAVRIAGLTAAVAAVVVIQDAVRRIPLQHARLRGGAGARAHLPVRLNEGGVMPVIFASSVLMVPAVLGLWRPEGAVHEIAELALIVFFAYFYGALRVDPQELADQLRRQGAATPGIRAGRATAVYLERVISRVTLAGGAALAVLTVGLQRAGMGGTALLIVVSATLETARQVEALALSRQYRPLLR